MAEAEPGRRELEGLRRLNALLADAASIADQTAHATATTAIQALLEFHGNGLERVLDVVRAAGKAGAGIIGELAEDELVGPLLLLHGLHPSSQLERVRRALDMVRPRLAAEGLCVELLSVNDGVVVLRLSGRGAGLRASAVAPRYAVEQAILAVAPDVTAIEFEGVKPHHPRRQPARQPIDDSLLLSPG